MIMFQLSHADYFMPDEFDGFLWSVIDEKSFDDHMLAFGILSQVDDGSPISNAVQAKDFAQTLAKDKLIEINAVRDFFGGFGRHIILKFGEMTAQALNDFTLKTSIFQSIYGIRKQYYKRNVQAI